MELLDIAHKDLIGIDREDAEEMLPVYAEAGPAFSIFVDEPGEPLLLLCIGGVGIIHEGVGAAWLLPSIYIADYKVGFHRTITRLIDDIIRANDLHRVQCYVHKDFEKSKKWVKRMGFEAEGLLKQFGQDKADYYIYARVENNG